MVTIPRNTEQQLGKDIIPSLKSLRSKGELAILLDLKKLVAATASQFAVKTGRINPDIEPTLKSLATRGLVSYSTHVGKANKPVEIYFLPPTISTTLSKIKLF